MSKVLDLNEEHENVILISKEEFNNDKKRYIPLKDGYVLSTASLVNYNLIDKDDVYNIDLTKRNVLNIDTEKDNISIDGTLLKYTNVPTRNDQFLTKSILLKLNKNNHDGSDLSLDTINNILDDIKKIYVDLNINDTPNTLEVEISASSLIVIEDEYWYNISIPADLSLITQPQVGITVRIESEYPISENYNIEFEVKVDIKFCKPPFKECEDSSKLYVLDKSMSTVTDEIIDNSSIDELKEIVKGLTHYITSIRDILDVSNISLMESDINSINQKIDTIRHDTSLRLTDIERNNHVVLTSVNEVKSMMDDLNNFVSLTSDTPILEEDPSSGNLYTEVEDDETEEVEETIEDITETKEEEEYSSEYEEQEVEIEADVEEYKTEINKEETFDYAVEIPILEKLVTTTANKNEFTHVVSTSTINEKTHLQLVIRVGREENGIEEPITLTIDSDSIPEGYDYILSSSSIVILNESKNGQPIVIKSPEKISISSIPYGDVELDTFGEKVKLVYNKGTWELEVI